MSDLQMLNRTSDADKSQQHSAETPPTFVRQLLATAVAAAVSCHAVPALAVGNARLPPIDSDPARCERAYVGNTLGMANAVSDKLLDLRKCVFAGKNLSDKVLSGALVSDADFSNATMNNQQTSDAGVQVTLTKAYAVNANFSGADMTNGVLDRVDFTRANLSGAKFVNAVVTGANFKDAVLDGAIFEDALIGSEDYKQLCLNPTVLTFLGWIVALAATGTPDGQVAYGSLDWWVIWLEFAVLLIAAGLHFMSFRASSVGVVGLLAVVTTLTMYMTNEYYFRYGAVSNNKRLNTAFAGFIILSICNSLLILVIGTHPEQIEPQAMQVPPALS
eukprot:jgi/Astpho2/3445/Aster-07045